MKITSRRLPTLVNKTASHLGEIIPPKNKLALFAELERKLWFELQKFGCSNVYSNGAYLRYCSYLGRPRGDSIVFLSEPSKKLGRFNPIFGPTITIIFGRISTTPTHQTVPLYHVHFLRYVARSVQKEWTKKNPTSSAGKMKINCTQSRMPNGPRYICLPPSKKKKKKLYKNNEAGWTLNLNMPFSSRLAHPKFNHMCARCGKNWTKLPKKA